MRFPIFLGMFVLFIVTGCETQSIQLSPTPSNLFLDTFTCDDILAYTQSEITCIAATGEGILLQTALGNQITLNTPELSLSFDSTVYIIAIPSDQLVASTIEGTSAISANGITQIIQPGAEVTIFLKNGYQAASPPTPPQPFNLSQIQEVPFDRLPHQVSLPSPIQSALITSIEAESGCVAPEGWALSYTIQRGDTLSRIATLQNISIDELQSANCILDPNRISPGQMLFVPQSETGLPIVDIFYAEHEVITTGECTTLHWSKDDARLVYYQGEAVARTDFRSVCPQVTTTYTLLVLSESGEQTGYTTTITVNSAE